MAEGFMDRMIMGDDVTVEGMLFDGILGMVGFGVLDNVGRGARRLGKEATEELTEYAAKQTKKELAEKLSKQVAKELPEEALEKASKETTEKLIDLDPKSLMLGDDWNNYFRKTYGYENVNWETAYDSPNDIIETPSIVTRMNPEGLYNYLNKSGLDVGPLGQGEHAGISFFEGGGYNAHFRTKYGDSYIQYNPSSAHHGKVPYYKVSSGNIFSYMGKQTGTQRFYLNGDIMND